MSKIHTELFMGKMYIWNLLQNNTGGRKINGDRVKHIGHRLIIVKMSDGYKGVYYTVLSAFAYG